MNKLSLAKNKIKVLLLEGIHQKAIDTFKSAGYDNIELLKSALPEDELIQKIKDVHIVGIRSQSRLTEKVLQAAEKLITVGCFCIGTNQVDLVTAKKLGIPVFNAPYSNTRSVAELVIAEIVMLLRRIPEKNAGTHAGIWQKTATNSYEARGKKLGIIGYGRIGTQVSVLAESFGMQVYYYDVEKKLPLGNATACATMEELLKVADIVTLHVPATPQTKGMFREKEIRTMRKGSYLLNLARGNVVDIDALDAALTDGHILGAAIDVFPTEPKSNDEEFQSPLRKHANAILTPHIGGSTLEAQTNIGTEVAEKLAQYSDNGSTTMAVNFPEVSLPVQYDASRFLHIHANQPGVLSKINEIFSSRGLNITGQHLQTDPEIGYIVVDLAGRVDDKSILEDLKNIPGTIRTRALY